MPIQDVAVIIKEDGMSSIVVDALCRHSSESQYAKEVKISSKRYCSINAGKRGEEKARYS